MKSRTRFATIGLAHLLIDSDVAGVRLPPLKE